MRSARVIQALGLLAPLGLAAVWAGCFIDNPNAAPAPTSTSAATTSTGAGGSGGGPVDAGSDAPPEPTLCEKYGGYPTVEKVAFDIVGTLAADCRINAFFTSLTAAKIKHIGDCVTKQLAVLTKCPDIKYDVDSNGETCRDMKASHHGLGIRAADLDAFVEDVTLTLKADGVEKADIDAMLAPLAIYKNDIVTNSAPGAAKDMCASDGGGP